MQKHFKIGEHVLCEPDYLQVAQWARDAKTNPDDLLKGILIVEVNGEPINPIVDGKIRGIDMSGRGLKILNLSNLNQLTELRCSENQLTKLDLSNLNQLEKLYCYGNLINEINISHLIKLTVFHALKIS